jgi:putative hemolysin
MSVWVDVFCLLLLVLLNGFFAMSEIAIVTARRSKLQAQAEAGSEKAKRALELAENPTRALSTIQVGITSIGILTGIVGESALVNPLAEFLRSVAPIAEATSRAVAMVCVVILITYISIVVGELVPKRLGQMAADGIARFVSGPICALSLIALPFVRLLSISTELIMKWIGVKPDSQTITEEEIHSMIEEGSETGVIDAAEHTMVRNVFRLDDRAIASLMVPRSEVEYIDLEDSREDNMRKILESKYSRLPVCVGGLDEVTGIVTTRQVLKQIATKGKPNFREISQPAVYVPESLSGLELLENFRKNDAAMALVVDEYGAVLGLVTPHDLLEAIAGEFKPDTPADANVVKLSEDSYDLDGLLPIVELKDLLKAGDFPGEDEDRYSTAAGMLMYVLERIPAPGDSADIDGWTFCVKKMDGRRIDRITATRIPVKEEEPKDG